MAILERYEGDANVVVNVDTISSATAFWSNGAIISTGIGKHPTAFKVDGHADLTLQMGVGGAVETILRVVQQKATTIMYQIDGNVASVLVEATGWGTTYANGTPLLGADDDMQAAIVAVGTRSADPSVPVTAFDFTAVTVSSTEGFKLA